MKDKATIYDLRRVCLGCDNCKDCPISVACMNYSEVTIEEFDELNKDILNWCEGHPIKTRQDKFLVMFPNVSKDNGIIDICPKVVDKEYPRRCTGDCSNCLKSYWLAEVEE